MQEHRGSAAAVAAADPSPESSRAPSPAAEALAARTVQAGAALALFEMAAWRLERRLADTVLYEALADALAAKLAPREIRAATDAMSRLLAHLGEPTRSADGLGSAADCIQGVVDLSRRLRPGMASPFRRGGWAVLRFLADARAHEASAADIADTHRVSSERLSAALDELVEAGCIEINAGGEHRSPTMRLGSDGVRQAQSDPLAASIEHASSALDEDALWRLIQLGSTLLRLEISATIDSPSREADAPAKRPAGT